MMTTSAFNELVSLEWNGMIGIILYKAFWLIYVKSKHAVVVDAQ